MGTSGRMQIAKRNMNNIILALFAGSALYFLWAWKKTRRTPQKYGLRTEPVGGVLKPLNFVFDALRATLGISLLKVEKQKFLKKTDEIVSITDTTLFGPQEEYKKGVQLWLDGPDQSIMSGSGIILYNGLTERLLNTRRWVVEYIQQHREEVLASKLDKPIIISGLPRTGSTMLYNLLSCDPDARTPRFFEMSQMANPMPPTTQESHDTDPRIQLVANRFEETEKMFKGMWTEAGKSHRSHPNEIEEDLLVLFHSMLMQLHVPMLDDKFRAWYEDPDNKEFAYIYHRLFFQALNHKWTPTSHWVLKAPIHTTYLPDLVKQYPDARLVFTHRDPVTVVPSWTRFLESYLHWSFLDYACDRIKFGRYITDSLVLCAKRLLSFRTTLDKSQFIDIDYVSFTKDPVGTVKGIYDHFGLQVSDEFVENMKAWIRDNRQGKYGRREYSLADYNLTKEQITEEFSDYNAVFFAK